jgi:predicted metal-binding membrane protein
MQAIDAGLAALLRRDRLTVAAALIIVTLLAWAYVLWLAAAGNMAGMDMDGMDMREMAGAMAPAIRTWALGDFAFMFAMWSVMMVGMMTPSVAPMILVYARVANDASARAIPFAPPMYFALGYFLAWTLFAVVATASQWGLEKAALLTPMLATASRSFGGVVLIVAGAYQWSPLKDSCLSQCRSPLSFVQHHGGFKPGVASSVRLGILHGVYCVGCCWALMALLFVAGVMNLFWVAGIMVFVLAEKTVPFGRYVARLAGSAAIVAGILLLAD